ncbi:endoribonuclease L-PSP [Trichoderma sp. SZMC 28014]
MLSPIRSKCSAFARRCSTRSISISKPMFATYPASSRYNSSTSRQTIIHTKNAAPAQAPYSQAVKTPSAIYCSGQVHLTADGDLIDGTIAEKTRKCCQNIEEILKAADSSLSNVVKTTVFISDVSYFAEMNAEYEKWFSHKPARSCVVVKGLPLNASVEIEVIALP